MIYNSLPKYKFLLLVLIFSIGFLCPNQEANAFFGVTYTCGAGSGYSNCACDYTCKKIITECGGSDDKSTCVCQSNKDTKITIPHITNEFIQHREWLTKVVWEAHVLPAMMLMTEQISAVAMQQMLVIGTFFDAKHQLETQRLLQELQAQAHKDYQPSKGMCEFGTNTRALAASDRNTDFTQIAIATRATQRNLLNGEGVSGGSAQDDSKSRFALFKETYCDAADFGNGMGRRCDVQSPDRINRDIDFTLAMDQENTLELDFSEPAATSDETDIFALSSNLYGHSLFPYIPEDRMATEDGQIIPKGAYAYMKTRALAAQRSVAQAAFAAQAAMKSQGTTNVAPYMQAILEEMGIKPEDAANMIGDRPSYEAQMNLLTKLLYQTPNFYTELYDKPTNIDRKIVSMQAIALMQRRDMYRSNLRREAIEAVWLENALGDLEQEVTNKIGQTSGPNNPTLTIEGFN